MTKKPKLTTADEYLASFAPGVQRQLGSLRKTIRRAAPNAEEGISYGVPSFRQHGVLVSYSAGAQHVAIAFPGSAVLHDLADEVAPFKTGKASISFPLGEALPKALIEKIVAYRVVENQRLHAAKADKET